MNKPNEVEAVQPFSGKYSLTADLKLNAWFLVGALCILPVGWWIRAVPDWPAPLRAGIVLIPLIPLILYVRTCVRFIRGMDELQRRIQLEAWLIAAIGTLLLTTSINVLTAHGLSWRPFDQGLEFAGTFVSAFIFYMIGNAFTSRRYR